ncbi:hypothetical protein Bca52824_023022 [Brassica carinata]|uniref:Uncharacterized protein n=1 Tax=Brassica carinata TaxID=52824 RepID=A0A8X7VHF4_BRACI|nr:hypothetical protein Bca52824_023022 [Brassica carinata]
MEETRFGGESEMTLSSGKKSEPSLRLIQDELEYMRIGCDKISRSDRATADHLGSLEKHIATM